MNYAARMPCGEGHNNKAIIRAANSPA